MTPGFERMFLDLQRCLVPRSSGFNEIQQQESLRIVEHVLKQKPRSAILRLRLFLFMIQLVSILSSGRSFGRLSPQKQHDILHFFYDSRISLLRKGFWGVNTLARLGVFGQPSVYGDMHYRIRPAGEHGGPRYSKGEAPQEPL